MRITNSHRGHDTHSTKCTKMTENESKIYGLNGVADSGGAALNEDASKTDKYNTPGGRLTFFKDGRFILELTRARDGEKIAWVPVPKKTFWPPQGSASSVSTYRQESSTSLSVSDDNSSVQSSPWQRDHTWKQATPQRNISNQLNFCYLRKGRRIERPCWRWRYRLQRCPHAFTDERTKCNNKCNNKCVKKCAIRNRPSLMHVVQGLWSQQALNTITSPRKRILRELERVTIDDLSYKRCRSKVNQQQQQQITKPVATTKPETLNGSAAVAAVTSTKNSNSSYSITSLLSGKIDNRDEKVSSQSHFMPTARITAHDGIAYAQDTVDGSGRSVDIMMNKRSPLSVTGSPSLPVSSIDHYQTQAHTYPAHHAPYVTPYPVYSPTLSHPHHHPHHHPNYMSPYYSSSYARATPAYYATGLAHPVPSPYSWVGVAPPVAYDHHLHRDDSISDVPLNLSKHAD